MQDKWVLGCQGIMDEANKVWKNPSPTQEDESKKGGLLVQEQENLEIERYTTFDMEEIEEVSTSWIEREEGSLTSEQEELSTSEANEKEAYAIPAIW